MGNGRGRHGTCNMGLVELVLPNGNNSRSVRVGSTWKSAVAKAMAGQVGHFCMVFGWWGGLRTSVDIRKRWVKRGGLVVRVAYPWRTQSLVVSFSEAICAGPTNREKISSDAADPSGRAGIPCHPILGRCSSPYLDWPGFRVDDRRQGYNIAGLQPEEAKGHIEMRQRWTTGFWVGEPVIGTSRLPMVFQVHMR
jgi:hypothetical protein